MRIAIGGIIHESNTFCAMPTDRQAFETGGIKSGNEILDEWSESHHEVGGFIEGSSRFDFEIVPTLVAWAMPAGPVSDDMIDEVVERIVSGIRKDGRIDGLLLALHGAMVTESWPDGDGEVLRRLRQSLGDSFPIVNTFDFHGNGSTQQIINSTAMVYYQTNPHIDQRACGLRAADLMVRCVRNEINPVMAIKKPPLIVSIVHQNTSVEPFLSLLQEARRYEQNPNVLAMNVVAGFPYADVPEMGPSVIAVTDGDLDAAEQYADELSKKIEAVRDQLQVSLISVRSAVTEAINTDQTPVVLVDFGDNVGGGSAADSTFILSELIRQEAQGAVVTLYDPEVVEQSLSLGVGRDATFRVGGKVDQLHGDPVSVQARVQHIYDGCWIETQPRHGGKRFNDQGRSVVLEIQGDNQLLITSNRQPPFSLGQLTSAGINPEKKKILVVKAAIAYRAAYEPIAAKIIEVDTPGITAVNPAHFVYKHIRRPLFPLDSD